MQIVSFTMLQAVVDSNTPPPYADNTTLWHHITESLHQSLLNVLSLLLAILPGILALVVALAIFTVIGMALSALLRRGLAAVKFDERLARGRNSLDWAPSTSPTELTARVSFWACVLLGLLIGVSAFDASYATATMQTGALLPYLTRIVGGVLLLIAGTLVARFLARSVLIGAVNAQLEYARFLSLGVKWLVLVLTAATVLDHLQIGGVVVELAFGILFGGIVLTLALAVGLGSRDLVSRSLEGRVEHPAEPSPLHHTTIPEESIRHF
jgi:hypothetical protein